MRRAFLSLIAVLFFGGVSASAASAPTVFAFSTAASVQNVGASAPSYPNIFVANYTGSGGGVNFIWTAPCPSAVSGTAQITISAAPSGCYVQSIPLSSAFSTVYATTSAVTCASDAACALLAHVHISSWTIGGVAGAADADWQASATTCTSGVQFTPSGATGHFCLTATPGYGALSVPAGFSISTISPATPFVSPQMGTMNAAFGSNYRVISPTAYSFTGGHILGTAVTIDGGNYTSTDNSAEVLAIPTSATGVTIDNLNLSFGTGIGIHENRASAQNTIIEGARISGGGYDVLVNQYATNAKGLILIDSYLDASVADAIEWNNPTTGGVPSGNAFYTAIGNIVSAGEFCFGQAGTQDWKWIANACKSSTLEGFHIEDGQRRGIIALNSCAACANDGIKATTANTGSGQATSDPIIVVGNHLAHSGSAGSSTGINFVYDPSGSLWGSVSSDNILNGFAYGLSASEGTQYFGGNAVENCTSALNVDLKAIVVGENISVNCTNLVSIGSGAIVDNVGAVTAPTNILARTGSQFTGGTIKSFEFPVIGSHPGDGSAHNVALFPVGTRMSGTLTVALSNGSTGFFYSAYISCTDGSTLTVLTNPPALSSAAGSFSGMTYNISGGNVNVNFVVSSPVTGATFNVSFSGIYYKE